MYKIIIAGYLALILLLLSSASVGLAADGGEDPTVGSNGTDGSEETPIVQMPQPSYQLTASTVQWQVISSGGTQATIGTDKVLLGTAIQTAIGEVTSPNYVVKQGFWSGFFYCIRGDADGNGYVSVSDAVFIVNYIFGGGNRPDRTCNGDYNGDGTITVADAAAIVRLVFVQ